MVTRTKIKEPGKPNLKVLQPVSSSNVKAMGYDKSSQYFLVEWLGAERKVSAYARVPKAVADEVLKADSKGRAVRTKLIGTYDHHYVPIESEPVLA